MRALIVDDSSFVREYLRHLLDRMGIATEEAVDGSDAIATLTAQQDFDLMLLDVVHGLPYRNARRHSPMSCSTTLRRWAAARCSKT